jgi:DNA-directed RNA polymerase subunit beta'
VRGQAQAALVLVVAPERDRAGLLGDEFEARRPKDAAIIAEKSGTISFGRDYKNKRRLSLTPRP